MAERFEAAHRDLFGQDRPIVHDRAKAIFAMFVPSTDIEGIAARLNVDASSASIYTWRDCHSEQVVEPSNSGTAS